MPLLLAAGRSCELHGLLDEAVACFALIQAQFPDSTQAAQAAGVMRRLKLPGQKLQLAGPTLDGNGDLLGAGEAITIRASPLGPPAARASSVSFIPMFIMRPPG